MGTHYGIIRFSEGGFWQHRIVCHFQIMLLQILLYLIQQKSQCMQVFHNLIGLGFLSSMAMIQTKKMGSKLAFLRSHAIGLGNQLFQSPRGGRDLLRIFFHQRGNFLIVLQSGSNSAPDINMGSSRHIIDRPHVIHHCPKLIF
jgi:hypothetical protein